MYLSADPPDITPTKASRMHAPAISTLLATLLASPAAAGVLIDYGYDPAALNDAGIVRDADNPNNQFGFAQFQAFNIDFADEAWRLETATIGVRVWNAIATGEASLAIYAANGLEPDMLDKRSADIAFAATSLVGEQVRVDLGGIVLEAGFYYIGIQSAAPTAELLWLAGDDTAHRTARRSDGNFFTGSQRALSLSLTGEAVPAPAVLAAVPLAGLIAARRRRPIPG